MENDFNYKWSKLFASKRYNTKDGVIQLTPEEQQELLDDSERVVKNCSIPVVVGQSEQAFAIHGVMQSAFAVIPDAERYLDGTNEVIAVFKHREQAERFAKALWKQYYIIEEIQSPHFA